MRALGKTRPTAGGRQVAASAQTQGGICSTQCSTSAKECAWYFLHGTGMLTAESGELAW